LIHRKKVNHFFRSVVAGSPEFFSSPLEPQAVADLQRLAINPVGIVGHAKCDRGGDISGCPTSSGVRARNGVAYSSPHAARTLGGNELERERARETFCRTLRCAIGLSIGLTPAPEEMLAAIPPV
jgi:hypothetical protein